MLSKILKFFFLFLIVYMFSYKTSNFLYPFCTSSEFCTYIPSIFQQTAFLLSLAFYPLLKAIGRRHWKEIEDLRLRFFLPPGVWLPQRHWALFGLSSLHWSASVCPSIGSEASWLSCAKPPWGSVTAVILALVTKHLLHLPF